MRLYVCYTELLKMLGKICNLFMLRNGRRKPINVRFCKLDVCLSVHRCICVEKKNRLDVSENFIALMIRLTCFGHFYAHHQELETICVLLPPMVCSDWLLVVGGQVQGSRL